MAQLHGFWSEFGAGTAKLHSCNLLRASSSVLPVVLLVFALRMFPLSAFGLVELPATHSGDEQMEAIQQKFWRRTHFNKSFYLYPVGGLGNMLLPVSGLLEFVRTHDANAKIVWGERSGWEFAGRWSDYFSAPDILDTPFPGQGWHPHTAKCRMNYECVGLEQVFNDEELWDDDGEGGLAFCFVCGLGGLVQQHGSMAAWFYTALRPAPEIGAEMVDIQGSRGWPAHKWIAVHIRRRDHATQSYFQDHWRKHGVSLDINTTGTMKGNFDNLPWPWAWQVDRWIDVMKGIETLDLSHSHRFWLSTDSDEAEQAVIAAFPEGQVLSLSAWRKPGFRGEYPRGSKEGQRDAVIDLFMLSYPKLIIGSASSTFTETASRMGGGFTIVVGCTNAKCLEDPAGAHDPHQAQNSRRVTNRHTHPAAPPPL